MEIVREVSLSEIYIYKLCLLFESFKVQVDYIQHKPVIIACIVADVIINFMLCIVLCLCMICQANCTGELLATVCCPLIHKFGSLFSFVINLIVTASGFM